MKKSKKTTVTTPVEKLLHSEELDHYRSILMEEFHAKFDLVLESIGTFRSEFKSEIKALRNDMDNQFSLVHAAIRCNADAIRELQSKTDQLSVDVCTNGNAIKQLNTKMDHLIDRVDDHDDRITHLEKMN